MFLACRLEAEASGTDLLDTKSSIQNGIFGVLFTITKEKLDTGLAISLLRFGVDFIQLFSLVFYPPIFGWHVNQDFWCVLDQSCNSAEKPGKPPHPHPHGVLGNLETSSIASVGILLGFPYASSDQMPLNWDLERMQMHVHACVCARALYEYSFMQTVTRRCWP